MRFPPVAIVGESCLLPGADDPLRFFAEVLAGRDLLTPAPPDRWRVPRERVLSELAGDGPDRAWSDRGGYVRGFESLFDPTGFRIPPEEILGLDPLFQWTLHTARGALRDAGHDEARPAARVGLILGNLSFPSGSLAAFAEAVLGAAGGAPDARNRFMSGLPAHLAARALALGAGAFALDAACASSLYALKLACDRLHDGTADVMLAGAVNCCDDLFIHVGFTALKALSRSGRSRPFHREADGLLPCEGAAFVVLKRLDDAVRAGDRIRGIVRGIGLSNDGRGSGLLAPSEEGQKRALLAAYASAEVAPDSISLLECHATGTPVGDATEIRSTAAIFSGCRDVPIGSVKSNLGHSITVAGLLGLLKVLGAMRAGVRPPTLHADAPLTQLAASPFRLLTAAEPWPADAPRRAGVSAFGFGGNNAHVIVEEFTPETGRGGTAFALGAPAEAEIAVVGLGVVAADGHSASDFAAALFEGRSRVRPREHAGPAAHAEHVELDAHWVKFPPKDLEQALPQQLLLLRAAREATSSVTLPRERTSVLVGMQCDATVARYGLRWRSDGDATTRAGRQLRDAIMPALDAAGVIGTMPNICANRLNSQLDLLGPSLTVSSEERSGLVALELAARALRSGEIDAAVVAAVDLSAEPLHEAAARAVLPASLQPAGDAAVVLVLKRAADALRGGERVLALLDAAGEVAWQLGVGEAGASLGSLFGHAHAASGLLLVAAGVLAASHRARFSPAAPAVPWLPAGGDRTVRVDVAALGKQSSSLCLRADVRSPARRLAPAPPRVHVFSGRDAGEILASADAARESLSGPARLAVVAAHPDELREQLAKARARLAHGENQPWSADGLAFRPQPVAGELAFVFAAPAGAYRGMGRELLLAFPELVDRLAPRFRSMARTAGWIYEPGAAEVEPAAKLWGSSFLCQVHAEWTRAALGLRPSAAIGLCSGETNALFALGAWSDLDEMVREIEEAEIYSRELAGAFDAVRRYRNAPPGSPVDWASWRVLASREQVEAAVAAEPLAHLTIVNAPGDYVVAGDAAACERIVAAAGRERARRLGYDIAVHCPEMRPFEAAWRRIHRRTTTPVPGVRFYTHATCDHYALDADAVADALTQQALRTVDFPRLVEKAWRDGVRVFLEHGPQGGCSRWIGRILGDREHVAVSLDLHGVPSLRQAFNAAAQLAAAGVAVDMEALRRAFATAEPAVSQHARALRYEVRKSRPQRRAIPGAAAATTAAHADVQVMLEPPWLPPILDAETAGWDEAAAPVRHGDNGAFAAEPASQSAPALAAPSLIAYLAAQQQRLAHVHRGFLAQQSEAHRRFLELRRTLGLGAVSPPAPRPLASELPPPAAAESPGASMPPPVVEATDASAPRGPRFSRRDLETHASGRISEVFGPMFQRQDDYARQVRMPEPPLLLADRVTGIAGEPGGMGTGTVWTETDVRDGSWYLHERRMPAGIMIEAGQADLFLISWLGVDFRNRGERAYRLLGCDLTYHGGLPQVGDTLRYDIHVDGHARQGEVSLFFFHYDCRIGQAVRLSVRNGQAGFFTEEELRDTGGVLWDAAAAAPPPGRVEPPLVASVRRSFDAGRVAAFSEGRALDCFGEGYERAATHVQPPRIAAGRMLLLGEVGELLPQGGPWGRGYLRALRRLQADDWFYEGHFKNDPCMPGTLMFEGCLQAMAFYLAALGYTLDNDGWRFEPVPDETFKLRCRGQALPSSRELAYEVFVSELTAEPWPTLRADILCSVDGVKAFHAQRLALRLVPDWPLTRRPAEPDPRRDRAASSDSLRLDFPAMLGCAWGRPSEALGKAYAPFDAERRMPRLPGPPYHFMSRATQLSGPIGSLRPGAQVEVEYDVPRDAWFFAESRDDQMPFAVLLEANLQPCGWLALGTGIPLESNEGLFFRNLDGTATPHRTVTAASGVLRTRVVLRELSRSAGMYLLSFDVSSFVGDVLVFEMTTGFGFFPAEALRRQVGLPASDAERERVRDGGLALDLPALAARSRAKLPGRTLFMLDRVSHFARNGGSAGLGYLRGEKDVRPDDWFFKAHFYQDPVQPGSLGLQALLQLVQCFLLERRKDARLRHPRFEPIATARALTWKYRGQVVPENAQVVVEIEITDEGDDERGAYAVADGWLWVDGLRIYSAQGLAMRIVEGE
jgi:acyl transferase domain-containing protein/3-hydroxymyristoyl/3-hydroxydecanoyl-(acyl carrier protein) dehydratase